MTPFDDHVLGYDPFAYIQFTASAALNLAPTGSAPTLIGSPTIAGVSDEFGRASTYQASFDGAAKYAKWVAPTRWSGIVDGKPFTLVLRYKSAQQTGGRIFSFAGTAGPILDIYHSWNTSSNDANRVTLETWDGAAGVRQIAFGTAGVHRDGQMHTLHMCVDPASGATAYLDGTLLTSIFPSWGAYSAIAEFAEACVGGLRYNNAFQDGAQCDVIYAAAIPVSLSAEQVRRWEQIYHGFDQPVRYAERLAKIWPSDTVHAAQHLGVCHIGDSQVILASLANNSGIGQPDSLAAWGAIRGAQCGLRNYLPIVGTRLGGAVDPGNGGANAADGVTWTPAENFSTGVPAEVLAAFPVRSDATYDPLGFIFTNLGYKGTTTAAAGSGATVTHLSEDFPLKAENGLRWYFMVWGQKAVAGSVTVAIKNNNSGATLVTKTVACGGAMPGSGVAWSTANYWAYWDYLELPAGSAIPKHQGASTPTLALIASGVAPCGFGVSRLMTIDYATTGGIVCSVTHAQGGMSSYRQADAMYNTSNLTQLTNLIAAEIAWMTLAGITPKVVFDVTQGRNDFADATYKYSGGLSPTGGVGVNAVGFKLGFADDMAALCNRLIAAATAAGVSSTNVGFVLCGMHEWPGDGAQMHFTTLGGACNMLRDNPTINGCVLTGLLISPAEIGAANTWFVNNGAGDYHLGRKGNKEHGVRKWGAVQSAVAVARAVGNAPPALRNRNI